MENFKKNGRKNENLKNVEIEEWTALFYVIKNFKIGGHSGIKRRTFWWKSG